MGVSIWGWNSRNGWQFAWATLTRYRKTIWPQTLSHRRCDEWRRTPSWSRKETAKTRCDRRIVRAERTEGTTNSTRRKGSERCLQLDAQGYSKAIAQTLFHTKRTGWRQNSVCTLFLSDGRLHRLHIRIRLQDPDRLWSRNDGLWLGTWKYVARWNARSEGTRLGYRTRFVFHALQTPRNRRTRRLGARTIHQGKSTDRRSYCGGNKRRD